MALHVRMNVPSSLATLGAAAEGLTNLNYSMMFPRLRSGADVPLLYESQTRYQSEPVGSEDWWNVDEVLRQGYGDCEDLAAYRAAELRTLGEPATVEIVPTSRGSYHAVVRRADGTIEDPSRICLALEAKRKANQ